MNALRKSDRMLKLMAYADGELQDAEREEVEAWIAEDASSVRFANELAGLGELVQLGHKGSNDAKTIAAFDITDAVMARVKEDKLETKKQPAIHTQKQEIEKPAVAMAVVSLDAARARRQKNLKVGATIAAVLALAASVFVMTRNKTEEPMARAPTPVVQPAPSPQGNGTSVNGAGGSVDVDVEQTPGNSVSVFYVTGDTNLSTSVVVWVDETGGK